MTPIPAQSGAEQEPEPGGTSGVRRGRHRKPRPRGLLLAAGGLAVAAGVLSLVRVAPESGVDAPGTAEAEPRLDPGGGPATDRSSHTAATIAAAPTSLPSATSAMGGRSLAPTPTGSPAPRTATAVPPGDTAVPSTIPTGAPDTPGSTPRPTPTASASRPATAPPAPTPTPTAPQGHDPEDPDPGGLCLPMISLCVDLSGGSGE